MLSALRMVAPLTAVTMVVAACSGGAAAGGPVGDRPGCIAEFDPAADYFPDKSTLLDATNFAIDYHRSYQVLTVKQPHPHGRPESYVLVRCGAPAPALTGDLAGAQHITVPVTSLYSASTTHLGMIAELGRPDVVTGVASPAQVTDQQIRARIEAGDTVGYAPGRQTNVEAVIGAGPDVLVTAGVDDPSHPKLRAAGIGVVANAEWLEATPLGRAEWIKVFAALTGTERAAERIYRTVRADYHRWAARTAGIPPEQVLLGAMYQGSWPMPSGAGYTGRLVSDAGGRHPWQADTGLPGLALNFESVYLKAGDAPHWLVTTGWRSLADAVAEDGRYATLAAFRNGQIWSATADYWERGAARPDLLLADMIAIMHPELAPGHHFDLYRQVPA